MRTPDSLTALVDHGIIDEVVRPLMSGKEAQVYLVLSGGEQRVAKIYKEAQNRSFQNRADYTEGRKVRNSRDQRAMGRGSRHGKAQNEAAWRSAEVDMIYRLRDAGVRVPNPHHFIDGVLIMELVVDTEGFPAPRLGDLVWEPADASALFKQLLGEVVRMLSIGVVHGDLSDFNVLMSASGPVVIDFPQSVDAATNANARKLLLRDVENLNRFAAKFDPAHSPLPYAEEMWELYKRNALTPETQLSGRFKGAQKAANTSAVLDLISDANKDERRRREARGLSMRGTSLDANEAPESGPTAGSSSRAERPARDHEPRRGAAGREPRLRAPGGAPSSARAPEGVLRPHADAALRPRADAPLRPRADAPRADAPRASTRARQEEPSSVPRDARAAGPERAARTSGQDRNERGAAHVARTSGQDRNERGAAHVARTSGQDRNERGAAHVARTSGQDRSERGAAHGRDTRVPGPERELSAPAPNRDTRAAVHDRDRGQGPDRDARAPSVRARVEAPRAADRPAARNFDIQPPLGERASRPPTQEREPHEQKPRVGGQDRELRTLREDRTTRGPGLTRDAGPRTPGPHERTSPARAQDHLRDERPRDERPRDERPRDERPRDERPRDERRVLEADPRRVPEGPTRAGGHAVSREAHTRVSSFGERVPYRAQHAEPGQRGTGGAAQGGAAPGRSAQRTHEQAGPDRSSEYPKRPR